MDCVWGSGGAINIVASEVKYVTACGTLRSSSSTVPRKTKENITFSRMGVGVGFTGAATGFTFTFRKNGGDANQSVHQLSGTTGKFWDTTNSDSLSVDDLYDVKSAPDVVGASYISLSSISFKADSPYPVSLIDCLAVSLNVNTSYYYLLEGYGFPITTRAYCEYTFRRASTLGKMLTYITSNSLNVSEYFGLAKNGDLNPLVTVLAGTTGYFYNDADTVNFAPGDNGCFYANSGAGSGSITPQYCSMAHLETNQQLLMMGYGSGVSVREAQYFPFFGTWSAGSGSPNFNEDSCQFESRMGTASRFTVKVGSNSSATAGCFHVRKNSTDVITVAVPAGSTGLFEDLTTEVGLASLDLLNCRNTAFSNYLSVRHIALWVSDAGQPYIIRGQHVSGMRTYAGNTGGN